MKDIEFKIDKLTGGLHVSISTERLQLESVVGKDLPHYMKLCTNREVMANNGDGAWSKEGVTQTVNYWTKNWYYKNPINAFSVFKNDDDKFIGTIGLEDESTQEKGQISLGYIYEKESWGKGFGKEAAHAVVKDYVPELVDRGYKSKQAKINSVIAVVAEDNIASGKIAKGLGMEVIKKEFEYGKMHNTFFISTEQLQKQKLAQQSQVPAPQKTFRLG